VNEFRRSLHFVTVVVIILALLGPLSGWAPGAREARRIGSDRQLFIDTVLVENSRNVALSMNPPVKTGERSIVAENPWETFYAGGYNTVMEDEGIYKMWYECSSRDVRFRGVCYATSRDGIRWEKPVLELFEFNGSKQNNILLECQGAPGSVFLDPRKPDGNRFKYLEWRRAPGKERPPTLSLVLFTSSDGLHWKPYLDGPILTMKDQFDTQNQIFWDDRIEKYVGYVRLNHRIASRHRRFLNNYPIRKVGRFETADLAKCPTPEVVFSSDSTDPEESDHYTSCVMKYPLSKDVYLMFPSAYLHDLEAKRNNDDGPMDIQLATSHDGIQWLRQDRRPYVRRGLEGSSDGGSLYMTIGMLQRGSEIWTYYTGYDFTHGGYDKTTRLKGVVSRLVQRLDGFMSLDSAYEGGEFTTVPLVFTGNRLKLNIDTSAMGSARVEILDQSERPVPGFTMSDCDTINGNYVNREVTWKNQSDVGGLAGKTVRLRFDMRSTKLYAFQFTGS